MKQFEHLVEKAKGQLQGTGVESCDTPVFRGIGYALLALAIAIKEK